MERADTQEFVHDLRGREGTLNSRGCQLSVAGWAAAFRAGSSGVKLGFASESLEDRCAGP